MNLFFIELTSIGGPRVDSKCYIKPDEILAFGEWFNHGTTIIMTKEERDIVVKETPEQIATILKGVK